MSTDATKRARHPSDLVMNSNGKPIQDIPVEAGVRPSYFTRVLRLSFLAPDITKTIVQGRPPPEFSTIQFVTAGRRVCDWSEQHRQLGFD